MFESASAAVSAAVVHATPVASGGHDWDDPPGFWPIFPLLWFVMIVAVVMVVWRFRGRHQGRRSGEAMLAERFAAGEISDTEYRDRLRVLRGKS